jgi:hypothetical protein
MKVHKKKAILTCAIIFLAMSASSATAGCKWVSRGFKSYAKCSGDVAKGAGELTQQLQTHVGKPLRDNVLVPIDRFRLEAEVHASASLVSDWIWASRNDAVSAGVSPIPFHIYQRLRNYYSDDLLQRVYYRVGRGNELSLPNLAFGLYHRDAIALYDVIVFRRGYDAENDDELWAHEVAHIDQYMRWGLQKFSIRYLRSWNSVEAEARHHEHKYSINATETHHIPAFVGNNLHSDIDEDDFE